MLYRLKANDANSSNNLTEILSRLVKLRRLITSLTYENELENINHNFKRNIGLIMESNRDNRHRLEQTTGDKINEISLSNSILCQNLSSMNRPGEALSEIQFLLLRVDVMASWPFMHCSTYIHEKGDLNWLRLSTRCVSPSSNSGFTGFYQNPKKL